jgi:hypothetical protein
MQQDREISRYTEMWKELLIVFKQLPGRGKKLFIQTREFVFWI